MVRPKSELLLKPKQIAVSVAACFALHAAQLQANPTGPSVVHGGVGFSGLGTGSLTITNQAGGNAIINWNGFSIGANELTKFQQFANLAVLNRVTGNDLSSILGALRSDGRVFLINPNGIVFGANARIDTAGLVASSLGLSDQDFLANRLRFTEVPGAGAVINNGVIQTTAGERVYLVAPTVENNGLIQSPQGAIVLAAGREVELVDANSPYLTVKVAAATDSAANLGSLIADSGRIGMFGALVRNAGTVAANGAVAGPGGEIRLVAAKDLTLAAGSTTAANGTSGGNVVLQAEGGTNLVAGTVEAKGSAGAGGEVNALGVRVGVVGHGVIDASGDSGGGTVLVGGDYQGKNAAVQNAERTYIGTDGVIRADAMTTGDGGRVIVWADGDTRFFGSISARGGSRSGNGGFVETSGKQALQVSGTVNAVAPNGQGGTWLLDPQVINLNPGNGPDNGGIETDGQLLFGEATGEPTVIGAGSIDAAFAYGNTLVQLQATSDINFNGNISIANSGSLTLEAGNDIRFNSHSISLNGNLTLQAAAPGGAAPTTGAITSVPGGGNITTNGGSVSATGNSIGLGDINTVGGSYGGGSVYASANTGDIGTGAITTGGGYVGLYANSGAVTVGGPINTSNVLTPGYLIGNGSVSIDANGNITTQSITTRSLHPGNGYGGNVTLTTYSGVITVNGTIDTRGADGVDDGFFSSQYYGGTSAGDVALGRSAEDGFAGTAITVNGNILASGGNGLTSSSFFSSPDLSGGDGGLVSMGGICDGPCIYGPANGNFVVTGVISTVGGAGGNSIDNADASSHGGQGGQVFLETTGSALVGAIDARGGNAGHGANGFNGNYGGAGGQVDVNSSAGGVTIGWVDASGGAGGTGGDISFASANGGDGGNGGDIQIFGGASAVVGTVVSRGGIGGNGGIANSGGYGAIGGAGGIGAFVDISSGSGPVSAIAIDTAGGAGGNGGSAYGGNASGNDGGDGGSVTLQGATGVGITASLVTRGGDAGSGGTSSGSTQAAGQVGGDGGQISVNSAYGSINIGWVDSSGGAGGVGGLADNTSFGATNASGGDGGEAGYMNFNAATSIDIGSVIARGGAGGAGGVASGGDPLAQVFTGAQGGDGGSGYAVYVNAQGAVTIGSIDASGGQGATGGVSMDASGGDGGYSAYSVSLYSATKVSTGSIIARGGNGGAGGTAQTDAGDSSGGSGGEGDSVNVQTGGGTGTLVTTGMVDVSGGNGGNSGPVGTAFTFTGSGGSGGSAYLQGLEIRTFGPLLAMGGSGGNYVHTSYIVPQQPPGQGRAGASGGNGGSVSVSASGPIQINIGGNTMGASSINVSGGAGGNGSPAASPAGDGGQGGGAGTVVVNGDPQLTLFGTINAVGGAGGAGGTGDASNAGGIGGAGGGGGGISVSAALTGNFIFVPTLDEPVMFNAAGGAGGAAGGGPTPGTAGTAGGIGSYGYTGTLQLIDPLSNPVVNSPYQQVVGSADESTVFVGGEDDKDKDEDKTKKEFGSCKG